jgi:hypothetical protein
MLRAPTEKEVLVLSSKLRRDSERRRDAMGRESQDELLHCSSDNGSHVYREKNAGSDKGDPFDNFRRGVLSRRSPIVTFVIAGPDKHALSELHCTIEGAMKVLNHALLQPMVLSGTECWESAAASMLRRKLDTWKAEAAELPGMFFSVGDGNGSTTQQQSSSFMRGLLLFMDCLERVAMLRQQQMRGKAVDSSAVAIGGLAASVAAATCAVRLHVGIE